MIGYDGGGVVFSADGKRVFIAASNSIDVMDAGSGKALLRRPVHGYISGMRLSPDGRRLLISGTIYDDNMSTPFLHVWDATDLKEVVSWNIEGSIAGFVDGGKHVILANTKGLRRFDPATGQEVGFTPFPNGMPGKVRAMGGNKVAATLPGLCVVDLAAPKKPRLTTPFGPRSVALAADGKYLAIGGDYNFGVLLYEVASGKPIRYIATKDRQRDNILGLAFAPDAKTLAFCSDQGQPALVLWDLQTHRPRWKVPGSAGQLVFSRDGKFIAGNDGWRTRMWDAATGKELSASDRSDDYSRLAFAADGRTLIAVHNDAVRLLDFPSGKERMRVTHPEVHQAVVSPDGRWLATSGFNHDLCLWDARSGREVCKLPDRGWQSGFAREFIFTSDSRRLYTWEADLRLLVWDVRTGRLLAEHRPRLDGFPKLDAWCFAADGSRFYWHFKKLRAYDTATGRVLRTFDQPLDFGFSHPQVSNDGEWLLTGGSNRGMTIFNLRQGKIAGHLPQPVGTFSSALRRRRTDAASPWRSRLRVSSDHRRGNRHHAAAPHHSAGLQPGAGAEVLARRPMSCGPAGRPLGVDLRSPRPEDLTCHCRSQC